MKRRKGFKIIKQFPGDEPIVSMLEFKNRIFIATNKRIYEMKDEKVEPVELYKEIMDGKEPDPKETFQGLADRYIETKSFVGD